MTYDFSTMLDRSKTGSIKWGEHPDSSFCPFSIADSDLPLAPEIIEGLRSALTPELSLGYNEATDTYKESVQNWFHRRHHYDIQPEWLVLMPGVVTALGTAIRSLTKQGDSVAILTPVYGPFYKVIETADRCIAECPLINTGKSYEIDFEKLEQVLSRDDVKMLILCSPHNPLGRVWSRDELKQIGELCKKYHILLVADEIHCDLIMPGHEFHSVMEVLKDLRNQMVVCTAASKTFNIAGQFTSNIFIPNSEIREAFKEVKSGMGIMSVNTLGMIATQSAYNNAEGWLDDFIQLIVKNDQMVREFFAEHYPEVYIYPLEGTYLQWIDFRDFLPYDKMKALLDNADIFLDNGEMFGDLGEGFERLNLSASTDSLRDMLQRFQKVVNTYMEQNEVVCES